MAIVGYANKFIVAFAIRCAKEHPGGLDAAILRPQGRAGAVEW